MITANGESELPEKPSLEHLRKQAKKRVKENPSLALAEAQHQLARELGFGDWAELVEQVEISNLPGRPTETAPLAGILAKILAYQVEHGHGTVDLADLHSKGILSDQDYGFMKSHHVEYDAKKRHVHMPLETKSEKRRAGVIAISGGPIPRKRKIAVGQLRTVADHLEGLPALPPHLADTGISIELSAHDGFSVSTTSLFCRLATDRWRAQLPRLRTCLKELGLSIMHDREIQGGRHIICNLNPKDGGRVGAILETVLLHGFGFAPPDLVSFSALRLDAAEPGFTPDQGRDFELDIPPEIFEFLIECINEPGVRKNFSFSVPLYLSKAAVIARRRFGAEAASRLRTAGVSSSATLGREYFKLVAQGLLPAPESGQVTDFEVTSDFDALFEV